MDIKNTKDKNELCISLLYCESNEEYKLSITEEGIAED